MNKERHKTQNHKPLAYHIRKTVRYQEKNGSPVLVLDFPLKAIVLDSAWRLILSLLAMGDFIPLEDIVPLIHHADPEKIEIFLNNLVHKGFLEREGYSTLPEYPFVSIIIPVSNRPEEITSCLQSLRQLDYPLEKLEIIVVDDASTDNTPDVVSRFPVSLIALKENKQASFCRNLAAKRAKGEILAFIDSDCLADPLWLKELVPAFKNNSLGAAGGLIDAYFEKKGLDHYEKVRSSLKIGSWFKRSQEGERFFYVPSCNLLARKDLFLRLGGFKEDLHVGEDVDLCWRFQDGGYTVEYMPMGRVYHKHRTRLRPFCSRRFDYGTSEPLLQLLHAKRIKELIFPPAESLFWLIIALSIALRYTALPGLSVIIVLVDSLIKLAKIRHMNIPIKFPRVLLAVFRSYFAFLYHCCAFVSRYYFLWSFIVFPLFPLASMIILGAHLLTGFVEFFVKKPHLNPLSFLFYFSLEQLSYQLGVWWGCLKNLYFHPVNPQIAVRPTFKRV